jgi:hypothetical protein
MKIKIISILVIALSIWYQIPLRAQGVVNLAGFESGNYAAWQAASGICCPVTASLPGPIIGRHTLLNTAGTDFYGGFSKLAPDGGAFTFKLGDSIGGGLGEQMSIKFFVPSNEYFINIAFAEVLQSTTANPSRFYFNLLDQQGNTIFNSSSCSFCNLPASSPGYSISIVDPSVIFRPWTNQTINLANYIGDSVSIVFYSGDDASGNGFGYGYFDITSAKKLEITESFCQGATNVVLTAPAGFSSYQWVDFFGNTVGTSSTLTLNNPSVGDSIEVYLTPFAGTGIIDTIGISLKLSAHLLPNVSFSHSLLCNNIPIQFIDSTAINSADSIVSLVWNFGDPLSGLNNTSLISNPIHSFTSANSYIVNLTATSIFGCSNTGSQILTVQPAPLAQAGAAQTTCANQTITLGGNPTASGGVGALSINWLPTIGISNNTASNPAAAFATTQLVTVTVLDNLTGCSATNATTISITSIGCINHHPTAIPDSNRTLFPNICTTNVIANDVDLDGNFAPQGNLTTSNIQIFQTPFHSSGTALVVANQIQFTPNGSYYGVDTLSYIVFDNGAPNLSDTALLFITINAPLQLSLGNDTLLCSATSTILNPIGVAGGSGIFSYAWLPTVGLSCSNCPNPIANPVATTTYQLTITDLVYNQIISDNIVVARSQIHVSLGNDTATTALNSNMQLLASVSNTTGTVNYTWNVAGGSCSNCNNPIYANISNTNYIVFITDNTFCTATDTVMVYSCTANCVWPGDADNSGNVSLVDVFQIGLGYGLAGPIRINNSLNFDGYFAFNYGQAPLNNVDFKHADPSNNGIINANDTIHIVNNLGKTHTGGVAGILPTNIPIPINIFLPAGPLINGSQIQAAISLGTSTLPADSIYGVSYTFNYTSLTIDTATVLHQNIANSWLYNNSSQFFGLNKYNRSGGTIDICYSRNNHISKSGFGNIAIVNLDINTDDLHDKGNSFSSFMLHCWLTNAVAITDKGKPIALLAGQDSVSVLFQSNATSQPVDINKTITITPNPATNQVICKTNTNATINKVELYNALGQNVDQLLVTNTTNKILLNLDAHQQGHYIIKLYTNQGVAYKKLVIQK